MLSPPLNSTLFPYTTLFRSILSTRRGDRWRDCTSNSRNRYSEIGTVPSPEWKVCVCGNSKGEEEKRWRSEEHTSELQSPDQLVCRLLLEKKKTKSEGDV